MNWRSPVTLADIAREAQVSVGTVSRVLNGREGTIKISQATASRVLDAAQRLGYQPNPFATALRTQRTGVLGAILRDMGDPFLSELARVLQQEAHQQGFELLIGHADYNQETAQQQVAFMLNHWFDGLFLLGNIPGDAALLAMVQQSRTPCVAVASGSQLPVPLVTVDERQGTLFALEYLFHLGHCRMAFMGYMEHAGVGERLAIFHQFVQEKSLVWHDEYELRCLRTPGDVTSRLHQLLSLPTPPTAIFCSSDALALRAISIAWQHGFHLPDQLSIIGFDDIEQAAESAPALTTIRQPIPLMAQEAVSMLRTLMDGVLYDVDQDRRIVQPELIVRASCSAALP